MAIAILNLMFISISGRIGSVVFYLRRGKQCVRVHVIGRNPDTEAQRTVRHTFADAVKSWQIMTQDEKYKFNRKARSLNMSGYNLYISGFMTERISTARQPALGLYPSGNTGIFPSVSPSNNTRFTELKPFVHLQYSSG